MKHEQGRDGAMMRVRDREAREERESRAKEEKNK